MLGSSGGGVCDAPLPWLTLDTLFTAISSPIAPFRTYCETNLASRLMPSAYCSEDRKSPKSPLAITDFITRIQGTGNTREFWEASDFSLEFGSSPWRKSHHFWIYFKWTVTSSQTLHFAQVCSNFVAFCLETAIDMTIWCLLWIRTTKYRRFLSVDPSKSSPPNVWLCVDILFRACCHPDTNSTQAVNTAKILIGLK